MLFNYSKHAIYIHGDESSPTMNGKTVNSIINIVLLLSGSDENLINELAVVSKIEAEKIFLYYVFSTLLPRRRGRHRSFVYLFMKLKTL